MPKLMKGFRLSFLPKKLFRIVPSYGQETDLLVRYVRNNEPQWSNLHNIFNGEVVVILPYVTATQSLRYNQYRLYVPMLVKNEIVSCGFLYKPIRQQTDLEIENEIYALFLKHMEELQSEQISAQSCNQ